MKKIILFFVALWTFQSIIVQAIAPERLKQAAISYMQNRNPENRLIGYESMMDTGSKTVAYLFRFSPSGFLIVSASEKIEPVYAYAVYNTFDLPVAEERSLKEIIAADLQSRIRASLNYSRSMQMKIQRRWSSFLDGNSRAILIGQWPPEGTTPTEGWLYTNWTQNFPYNAMCPMDLNAGSRSVAGCPAIAMAQILNYHREINETRFDAGDDYYHSYGAGNSYMIDDDYLTRGFPCFDTLNLWLDTLESTFQDSGSLTNSLKAALCFACGVAAQQVYTASVSGTFGMEQAAMAYQRFGFSDSRLVYPDDTTLNSQIAENIKVALPVHLGLLVSTGSGGHNVVVDGYNTDEFYHFNFGWGGPANGWYTLPPTGIPYNLTIIESALLDIKSKQYTAIKESQNPRLNVFLYPNPMHDFLVVDELTGQASLTMYNLQGESVFTAELNEYKSIVNFRNIPSGCYIYHIKNKMGDITTGKLIKE